MKLRRMATVWRAEHPQHREGRCSQRAWRCIRVAMIPDFVRDDTPWKLGDRRDEVFGMGETSRLSPVSQFQITLVPLGNQGYLGTQLKIDD